MTYLAIWDGTGDPDVPETSWGEHLTAADYQQTETELKEAIIHLAFYAGWPRAMSAITVAKTVFGTPGAPS